MQRDLAGWGIQVHRVYEGLVNLEEIQLETFQECQTGITRAKVVDRDPDSDGAQLLDDFLRVLRLHEAALADLDNQVARGGTRVLGKTSEQSDGAVGVQIRR